MLSMLETNSANLFEIIFDFFHVLRLLLLCRYLNVNVLYDFICKRLARQNIRLHFYGKLSVPLAPTASWGLIKCPFQRCPSARGYIFDNSASRVGALSRGHMI